MWFKSKTKDHADQLIEKAHQQLKDENILGAISTLEHAIKLDKEYATPYSEYGIALAIQKNNETQAEYNGEYAVIKDSKSAVQWRNLAHIYYLLGQYQRAFASIIVAETIDPNLEHVEDIKLKIEEVMGPDKLDTMERIEEKAKHVFSNYEKAEMVMPDPFFQEALNI